MIDLADQGRAVGIPSDGQQGRAVGIPSDGQQGAGAGAGSHYAIVRNSFTDFAQGAQPGLPRDGCPQATYAVIRSSFSEFAEGAHAHAPASGQNVQEPTTHADTPGTFARPSASKNAGGDSSEDEAMLLPFPSFPAEVPDLDNDGDGAYRANAPQRSFSAPVPKYVSPVLRAWVRRPYLLCWYNRTFVRGTYTHDTARL